MKITFDEVLSKSTPLLREILQSLTKEVFKTRDLEDTREWDVKLLINGVEVEPVLYNTLFSHTEEWIEEKAKEYLTDKLDKADDEINELLDYLNRAKADIADRFNISED